MMRTYLSDMESMLKGGDLSVANFDLNDIKGMDAYHSIIDSVFNRGDNGEGEISEMTFEHLPLSVIEQNKDAKLGNLTDDQKYLLTDAFKQLKSGEIDRAEYLRLYLDIPKLEDSEEVPQSIVDFIYDNKGDLGYTLSADTITEIINQTTHAPPPEGSNDLNKISRNKSEPDKNRRLSY